MDIAITLTDSEDQCLPLDHRGHKRRFEGDTNDSEHEDDSGADEDLNSDANHEGDGDADSGSSFEALVSSRAKRTRATVRVRNDDDESTDVDVTVARAQPEEAELFTYKETAVSLMVGRGSRQSSQTERNAVAATADAAHKDRVLSLWSTTERPKKVAKVASGAASNAATVAARQSSQTTSSQVMRYTSQTSVRATQATTQASQTTQRELSASGSSTIDITTTQTTSARAPTTSSAALTSKQAKQATAAAKKAQREAAKRQRAEQRAADKRAKAADKEARRLHSTTEANAEIVVCADTRLAQQVRTGDPTTVLQAMQAQKVEHCVTQLRVERSLIWCRLVESRVARGTVIELSDGRRVCREPFAAICFTGAEFMRAARDDRLFELADAVRRANVDDTSVIFIVEGLDRAIVEHERARVHLLSPSNQARSAAASAFDLQKFERMWHIVRLQLAGVHVQETLNAARTADYIASMSAAVGFRPYKKRPVFETFSVRATSTVGKSKLGVWPRMLSLINGVSLAVAQAIAAQYPTFKSLVIDQYGSAALTAQQKEALLTKLTVVRKTASRTIGPAISKRVCRVFTETNAAKKVLSK